MSYHELSIGSPSAPFGAACPTLPVGAPDNHFTMRTSIGSTDCVSGPAVKKLASLQVTECLYPSRLGSVCLAADNTQPLFNRFCQMIHLLLPTVDRFVTSMQ